jgi:hypothetical protein
MNSRTMFPGLSVPLLVKSSSPSKRPSWKTRTRKPNAALRLSALMSRVLIGSTPRPVSRKSTANETSDEQRRGAAGSRAPRLDCWSAKRAADPVSCTSSAVGSARTRSTSACPRR